jgi:hypothetical protein
MTSPPRYPFQAGQRAFLAADPHLLEPSHGIPFSRRMSKTRKSGLWGQNQAY